MRQGVSRIAMTVAGLLLGTPACDGQEKTLLDVITAHWTKYKERFRDYQFRLTKIHRNLRPHNEGVKSSTVEVKQSGAMRVFLRAWKEPGDATLVGVNSRYAFALAKSDSKSAWHIKEVDLDISDGVQLKGV